MGLEDLQPGMKVIIIPTDDASRKYHGELIQPLAQGIAITLPDAAITHPTTCNVQVTVDNVLYCWENAAITPDKTDADHYQVQISSRPKINNRRKYQRKRICLHHRRSILCHRQGRKDHDNTGAVRAYRSQHFRGSYHPLL